MESHGLSPNVTNSNFVTDPEGRNVQKGETIQKFIQPDEASQNSNEESENSQKPDGNKDGMVKFEADYGEKYTFSVQYVTQDMVVRTSGNIENLKMISKESLITCRALFTPTGKYP